MRYEWRLGLPEFATIADRRIASVLIEYDGPQLVVLRDNSKRWHIGLAADHDASAERWIHAQVTEMELEALCTEGVTMRNVVCKPTIEIVDYVSGRPHSLWRVAPERVPAGILPLRGAYLPLEIGRLSMRELRIKQRVDRRPIFRCGGRVVQDNAITFAGISAVTKCLQALWTSIANAVFPAGQMTTDAMSSYLHQSTLRMVAGVPGSFGIGVDASDNDAFARIASVYKSLLATSPDDDVASFAGLHVEVLRKYAEYLKILETNGIEVLTNWSNDSAFVGYAYAEQARAAVTSAIGRSRTEASAPSMGELISVRGFFDLFGLSNKKFEFYNTQTGDSLSGIIDADLAKRVKAEGEVRVGHKTQYDVQIDVAAATPVLMNLYHVQGALFRN
jgi:hypothetical protein